MPALIVDDDHRATGPKSSWDLSANYQLNDRMNVYGTIQSGYQSGQFPPRPFCLFGFVDFAQASIRCLTTRTTASWPTTT